MTKRRGGIAGLAAILAVVALAVWSGAFNVAATSANWRMVDQLLHYATRASIRTYALAVTAPDPLPKDGIVAAAGHFARGCAGCHGAPGQPRSPVVLAMTPPPPDLARRAAEWTDAELFRIVRHGIGFTGMPAWPVQDRDDDVWAMVAFLRELPTLTPAAWQELSAAQVALPVPSARVEAILADCARCHGADGRGRSPTIPVLAGQSEAYLAESLRAYASGARPSGIMTTAIGSVPPDFYPALARHYAALPGPVPATRAPASDVGRLLVEQGAPTRRIPACAGCHLKEPRNPLHPSIVGQPETYVARQLQLFRDGTRGGGERAHLMTEAAARLTDDDIRALAEHLSQETQ